MRCHAPRSRNAPSPALLVTLAFVMLACALLRAAPAARADVRVSEGVHERRTAIVITPDRPVVESGDLIELTWGDVLRDVEEMELLLSIDDGRHFPLRISPELEPHSKRYRWRVPNVPTDQARIRVRVRIDEHETWMPVGGRFAITAKPGASVELDQVHEAGWWGGLDEHDSADGSATWCVAGPQLSVVASGDEIASPARDDLACGPPPSARARRMRCATESTVAKRCPPELPRFIPPRK
jgi:hypothetical protein